MTLATLGVVSLGLAGCRSTDTQTTPTATVAPAAAPVEVATATPVPVAAPIVERVSTAVPYPRGLAVVDGQLIALARGRVRSAGGVSAAVEDRAGTLFRVDMAVSQPLQPVSAGAYTDETVSPAVRANGTVLAEPTSPPFNLWNRAATPPEADRVTDRPYCSLRYHAASQSYYLCAFSGIDKPRRQGDPVMFSKNTTDAILRYDLRTQKWYDVERHAISAGGSYPHHDVRVRPAPHGWLNGPDNCLVLGNTLYAVAKDNSVLAAYDLTPLVADPEAGAPASRLIFDKFVPLADGGTGEFYGHSMLAAHDGWLYVGFRTSSIILRLRLDAQHQPVQPIAAEIVARFEPYDPQTGESANLTDMGFDERGRLYVISAEPSRVHRFSPNPQAVYDGRTGQSAPWVDLAAFTGNAKMKSENVMYHDGWLYVTSGDGYGYQKGAEGTIYRVKVTD